MIVLVCVCVCVCKNIRDNYINIFSDKKPLNYEGKWILREKDDLEYDKYNIRIEKQGTILIIFYISGERLFGYASPWYLLRYIGDPDGLNLYKFTKIK